MMRQFNLILAILFLVLSCSSPKNIEIPEQNVTPQVKTPKQNLVPQEETPEPSLPTYIEFPDTNLASAIQETLGLAQNEPIPREDMEGLQTLFAVNGGITNSTYAFYRFSSVTVFVVAQFIVRSLAIKFNFAVKSNLLRKS